MHKFSLPGIHPKTHKATAAASTRVCEAPGTIEIPMAMGLGRPAKLCVSVGDRVAVGQKIGEADGAVSVPVHAGISGTVRKIRDFTTADGKIVPSVVIEGDGEDRVADTVRPIAVNTREDLVRAARELGIIGLGGAGFPAHVKLDVGDKKVDTVLINGAECEPYITSDFRRMLEDGDAVIAGAQLVRDKLGAQRAVICIEDNKPEAIALMRDKIQGDSGLSVLSLPEKYPSGAEKVLIYLATGREVKKRQLPIDHGVIVMNVSTVAELYHGITTGMPLVRRVVTVDGSAVSEPGNVDVPVGTSIRDVIALCGGYREEPEEILMGGPMMGVAVPSDVLPVLRNNNAILAFGRREAELLSETPCIRCGRCAAACPYYLIPFAYDKAYRTGDIGELERLEVDLCMECGNCSYVCPAKRHLVMRNRLSKALVEVKRRNGV